MAVVDDGEKAGALARAEPVRWGEPSSCGTGACAAVAAAQAEGYVRDRVVVELPGGALSVWLEGDSIVLGGPAAEVFRGEWAGGTGSARPAGE